MASQPSTYPSNSTSTPSLPPTYHDIKRRKISSNRFIPSHVPEDLWGSDTEPDEDADELAKAYLNSMSVVPPDTDASSYAQECEQAYVLEVNPTISALAQELQDEEDDAARERLETKSQEDESDSDNGTTTHYSFLSRTSLTPVSRQRSAPSRSLQFANSHSRHRPSIQSSQHYSYRSLSRHQSSRPSSRYYTISTASFSFSPHSTYEHTTVFHTVDRRASEGPSRF
jgi:hypothetical protein